MVGLDVFGMVYINITMDNGDATISFEGNDSPTIEIPVVENAKTKPGKTMAAWHLHRWSGVYKINEKLKEIMKIVYLSSYNM